MKMRYFLLVTALVLLFIAVQSCRADNYTQGSWFITATSDYAWYVTADFWCTDVVVGEYCVNITGGPKEGDYCAYDANVSVTACLSEWIVYPTNATNATGFYGQDTAGCAFNVTNNGGTAVDYRMKYTGGNLTYDYHYDLDTFTEVDYRYTTNQTIWENSTNITLNWTRLCFHADKYTDNYTQGLSSMRVTYNFNNSDDGDMEYYNGSDYVSINTTWGCYEENWVRFNNTADNDSRENFSVYTNYSFDYMSLSGNPVSMYLNITDGQGTSTVSDTIHVWNTSWNVYTGGLSAINTSSIQKYAFHFIGQGNCSLETATDVDCGLPGEGYSTNTITSDYLFLVNYTIPTGADQATTLWEVKHNNTRYNVTIPSECWNTTKMRLGFYSFNDVGKCASQPVCWNSSGEYTWFGNNYTLASGCTPTHSSGTLTNWYDESWSSSVTWVEGLFGTAGTPTNAHATIGAIYEESIHWRFPPSDGKTLIDNLHFNASVSERKIDLYVGNSTFDTAVNMTGTYQTVFDVPASSTMPLNFWFKYYAPYHGTSFSFTQLFYDSSTTGSGEI